MPCADKAKQRQAQADSQRKRYHAPGSKLPAYYRAKTRARRRRDPMAVARRLLAIATERARYGYTGALKPKGF